MNTSNIHIQIQYLKKIKNISSKSALHSLQFIIIIHNQMKGNGNKCTQFFSPLSKFNLNSLNAHDI